MTISVSNVVVSANGDTFGTFANKFNTVASALSNTVVTTNSNTTTGNASISGTFISNNTITNKISGGNTSVANTLSIDTTLSVSNNASISGNVTIDGRLNVNSVTNATTINANTLTLTNNATVTGSLSANNLTATGNITVSGNVTVTGNIFANVISSNTLIGNLNANSIINNTNTLVSFTTSQSANNSQQLQARTNIGVGNLSIQNTNDVSVTNLTATNISTNNASITGTLSANLNANNIINNTNTLVSFNTSQTANTSQQLQARTNIGVGNLSIQNTNDVSVTNLTATYITSVNTANVTASLVTSTTIVNSGVTNTGSLNVTANITANNISANTLTGNVNANLIINNTNTLVSFTTSQSANSSQQLQARTNIGVGNLSIQNTDVVAVTNLNATNISTGNASITGTLSANLNANNIINNTNTLVSFNTSQTANGSQQLQARTNIGLGTIATQNANNVTANIVGGSITGITDLAIADGGTGASNTSQARLNLGLGTSSTQDASNVNITGGTISGISPLPIASGGTNSNTVPGARNNLGLGTIATQNADNVTVTVLTANVISTTNVSSTLSTTTTLNVTGSGNVGGDLTIAGNVIANNIIATVVNQINANNIINNTNTLVSFNTVQSANASQQSQARTNIGLGTIATQNANNVSVTNLTATYITSVNTANVTASLVTSTTIVNSGVANTNSLNVTTSINANTISANVLTGNVNANLIINNTNTLVSYVSQSANGTQQAQARTNIGLGTLSTQNANNVTVTNASANAITTNILNVTGTFTGNVNANNIINNTNTLVSFNVSQSANTTQKAQARTNIDAMGVGGGTFTGNISVPSSLFVQAQGAEGGEIRLIGGSDSTLVGNTLVFDTTGPYGRIFELNSPNKGFRFNTQNGTIDTTTGIAIAMPNVNITGGSISGISSLGISGSGDIISSLSSTSNNSTYMSFQNNGVMRWAFGKDVNADLTLWRYNSTGVFQNTPLTVNNTSGSVSIPNVSITGGTISGITSLQSNGNITVGNNSASWPALIVNSSVGTSAMLAGRKTGVDRWLIELGNFGAETGSNAGSDLAINRYSDLGAYLSTPFSIVRSTGVVNIPNVSITGGTISGVSTVSTTGNVIVGSTTNSTTVLDVRGIAGSERALRFQSGANNRFFVGLGSTTESGNNVGSDFQINRYNDAGTYISTPITISRASGAVTIPNAAITGGSVTGITDITIADGGTGASNTFNARANLGTIGNLFKVTRFVANGTFTTDTETKAIFVKGVAGGGGGGGALGNATNNQGSVAAGGAAGMYGEVYINTGLAGTYAVTVGDGGTGGDPDSNLVPATAGGNSSFGSVLILNGGPAAPSVTASAVPHTAASVQSASSVGAVGDLLIRGEDGQPGIAIDAISKFSGRGGNSFYGGGGAERRIASISSISTGVSGRAAGAGGSGGISRYDTTVSGGAGGAGVRGYIEVWEFR